MLLAGAIPMEYIEIWDLARSAQTPSFDITPSTSAQNIKLFQNDTGIDSKRKHRAGSTK